MLHLRCCRGRPIRMLRWPGARRIVWRMPAGRRGPHPAWPTRRRRPGCSCRCRSTPHPPPPSVTPPEECSAIARKPPSPPQPPAAPGPAPRRPAARKPAAPKALPATPGTPRKKATTAGPSRRAAAKPAAPERLDALQNVIVASLEDDKAEQVVAIDLAGRASFADRMVIATGIADRQITAMATHLEEKLAEAGLKRVRIEGAAGSDWVLIDCGDIIVHLFKPEARSLYGLEKMWGAELDESEPEATTG